MDKYLLEVLNNKTSWDGISAALKDINKKDPAIAGKLFEHLCRHYYRYFYDKEFSRVWLFEDIPFNLRSQLGLSGGDYGVDLLIQTAYKRYVAVQCKFRNDENAKISWTKDKLANLFAEGSQCDHFIIFTNAAGVDEHSIGKYKKKLTVATYDILFDNFTKEHIRAICQLIKTGQPPQKSLLKPRPHQTKAITAVVKGFKNYSRGQLILPCGAGKTLAALWIRERLKSRLTLVLVPSLALLRQFYESWKYQQKEYLDYLCVCSEEDIDKNADSNVSHTYEIQAPSKVTTDPEIIIRFLRKFGPRIIYSTYQSSPQIARALKALNLQFDLAICDEAHKTTGERKYSAFSTVLDEKKIPCKKRLFMTATPRVVSSIVKDKLGDNTYAYLADMNDADTYGPQLFRMSFAEAIEKGILVDYKIIAVGITNNELQQYILKRQFAKDATLDEIANNYALEKIMHKQGCRHAVSFHSSVRKAEQFRDRHASLYKKVGSFHINGQKTTKERKQILRSFKDSHKAVVTNARCLTEGIDVPAIDVVYFCDPKYSKIDIVQAAGRALRQDKEKDKKFGHIIVPIYHRFESELKEHIESGIFSQLIRVVRAMADQDERIEEEITDVVYGRRQKKTARRRIHIDGAKVKLIEIEGFAEKLQKSIYFDVIRKTIVAFRPFDQACSFVHKLKLKSTKEWRAYCRGEFKNKPSKPNDIPTAPNYTYQNKGWKTWGDWLGTGTIADNLKVYRPFAEARKFAKSLHLKSQTEWFSFCRDELRGKGKFPDNIPTKPDNTYANKGWKSYGDWLGTGSVATRAHRYWQFAKARKFVQRLGFRNQQEYKEYVRSLAKKMKRRLIHLPINPSRTYFDKGWASWGDWLGTGRIADRYKKFWTFKKARKLVCKLGLKNQEEWKKYTKGEIAGKLVLPTNIPIAPWLYYKRTGEWTCIGDWLGTGKRERGSPYLPFRKARLFVRALGLVSGREWRSYCQGKVPEKGIVPSDIPTKPERVYNSKEWKGMQDWLGYKGRPWKIDKFRNFIDARKFAQSLGLRSRTEWKYFCKGKMPKKNLLPNDIPKQPHATYKNKGWRGYGDWLGTGNIKGGQKRYFRDFYQARKSVHKLKIKGFRDWRKYCEGNLPNIGKIRSDIPKSPNTVFKNKGWKGWADWLGHK